MKKKDVNCELEILALESADNQQDLSDLVETFLKSIKEFSRSRGETYAETAKRFRDQGYSDCATVMYRAERLWSEVLEDR